MTHHHRLANAERIQQSHSIAGEILYGISGGRFVGIAVTSLVGYDSPHFSPEERQDRAERERGIGDAVKEENGNGLTGAGVDTTQAEAIRELNGGS